MLQWKDGGVFFEETDCDSIPGYAYQNPYWILEMPNNKYESIDEILEEVRRIYESRNRDLKSLINSEILVNALKVKRDELDTLDLKVINRALQRARSRSMRGVLK